MHGDDAYCKKNGHYYKVANVWKGDCGIWHEHIICLICGHQEIRSTWEEDE